jgi:hypothetical protein
MKKTFVVILVIQFILMGLFLVYALVQKTQAERAREIAYLNEQRAKEAEHMAQEQKNASMEQTRRARQIVMETEQKLEECLKSRR